MGSRSPAGPRRLGTATRMSASLSRRLSAFFGSTPDQGQKAAKYAVLIPGHAEFPNRAHSGLHGETRAFRMGVVSLPSERSTRFGNPAWPGFKTANFAAFGSWSETLLKNVESLRSSDALMRVAVPKDKFLAWIDANSGSKNAPL